jgi:hypothetical protein
MPEGKFRLCFLPPGRKVRGESTQSMSPRAFRPLRRASGRLSSPFGVSRRWIFPLVSVLGLVSFSAQAILIPVGSLTLSWTPASDPSVAGYNLYYGTESHVYANVVAVDNTQVSSERLR